MLQHIRRQALFRPVPRARLALLWMRRQRA